MAGILALFLTFAALMYAIHIDYQNSKEHKNGLA